MTDFHDLQLKEQLLLQHKWEDDVDVDERNVPDLCVRSVKPNKFFDKTPVAAHRDEPGQCDDSSSAQVQQVKPGKPGKPVKPEPKNKARRTVKTVTVVVGHRWVLFFVRFEECHPLGLELWGCCLCCTVTCACYALTYACCSLCQLTMKVTCGCGMVVSDHDNAMREHLKSHAHRDRLANAAQGSKLTCFVFATAFYGSWVGAS